MAPIDGSAASAFAAFILSALAAFISISGSLSRIARVNSAPPSVEAIGVLSGTFAANKWAAVSEVALMVRMPARLFAGNRLLTIDTCIKLELETGTFNASDSLF